MFAEVELQEGTGYQVLDGCYSTVVGVNRKGAYLTLDNGEDAYAFRFANLRCGTEVLCTVRRMATEDRRKLVTIDSVRRYPAFISGEQNDAAECATKLT